MYVFVSSYNIMYILPSTCTSQNWSKIQTDGKKPPARMWHSACYMTGDNPVLMVVGGFGPSCGRSDVWLLDVTNGSWSEVLHTCTRVITCGVFVLS